MPMFRVSVVDEKFRTCNDYQFPSIDDAHKHGIRAALAIGTEEVIRGKPFFAAEVLVEGGAERLDRFVVSIGASAIQ